MKPADRQFFGNLFQDFQQGHQFGSNIIDTNRRRQMEDEQRKREAALDPARLAKAQVDAERARLEYQQLPEEHRRKGVELDLAKQGMDLRSKEFEYQQGSEARKAAEATRERTYQNFGKFPTGLGQQEALTFYQSNPNATPEELQKGLNAIYNRDVLRHRGERISEAGGVAGAQQGAITRATLEREQLRGGKGSPDVDKTIEAATKARAKTAAEPWNSAASEFYVQELQKKLMLAKQNLRKAQSSNNPFQLARYSADVANLENTLGETAQQMQQSLAPAPSAQGALSQQEVQSLMSGNPDDDLDPTRYGLSAE